MPGKVLGDPASLGYGTNAVQTSRVMRYAENLAVFTESTILFQNLLWNIQQADIGLYSCLLSIDAYPKVFIKIGADVLFRQVTHIRETQSREDAEHEQITIQFLLGIL